MIANPIRIDGVALPHRAAPRMGEHDDVMLREAGFDAAAIARLRELGVIAGRSAAPAPVAAELDVGHAA
jgi:formyl-CoA transferase